MSSVVAEVEARGGAAASTASSGNADCSEVTLRTRFTARRYLGSEVYCRLGYNVSSHNRWMVNGALRGRYFVVSFEKVSEGESNPPSERVERVVGSLSRLQSILRS